MYSIKLSSGRELTEVKQNGVMLSTTEAITREELERGLWHVVITGEPDGEEGIDGVSGMATDYRGEYAGMELKYFSDSGEKREFVITPMSEEKLAYEALSANLEYVAMKAGVEL